MNKQENNHAVLGAIGDLTQQIGTLAQHIHERFEAVDKRFEAVDKRFEAVDKRFNRIEALMVTKDYLDEKLADLRGDLVVLTRKEDRKVEQIVQKLKEKNIFNDQDVKEILTMEPFPKLV